ncbi:ATP-binding protein [Sphingosinicella sp. BN140058]|uniref:PAS domain-containing sensor histidine kinase n=1 Tax=Sphingosinicella sp. BN140058 TaxID=1892855 RepID=UPI0013EB5FB7|nr:ATP-binding protein [Sphingosinicella sp. BN140058]
MIVAFENDRLVELVEHLRLAVVVIAPDFKIGWASKAAAAMDGRTADVLVGRSVWEVWPDLDALELGAAAKQVMKAREPRSVRLRFANLAEERRWAITRVEPWGEGIAFITREVTAQSIAQTELDDLRSKHRLLTQAAEEVLWEWDVDADRLVWSPAGQTFFGEDIPDGVPIRWWLDRIHPDDRARVWSGAQEALSVGGGVWVKEYRVLAAAGRYARVRTRAYPTAEEAGRPTRLLGALIDLSAAHQAAEELRRLQAELVQMSRISAMGTMASTLAHELNQPLTAARNFIGGLERAMAAKELDRELLAEGVQHAKLSIDRAGEIIRSLRRSIDNRTAPSGVVDLRTVCDDALAMVLLGVDKASLAITLQVPRGLLVVGDAVQLQHVFINLLRNAVEAMHASDMKDLGLRASDAGAAVRVEISDRGPGIPAAERNRLFEPVASLKERGLGIGLSISRTIVEKHGGKIWVEDRKDGGTRFIVQLKKVD